MKLKAGEVDIITTFRTVTWKKLAEPTVWLLHGLSLPAIIYRFK